MTQESEVKLEVLRGFLHGEGDIEGIACKGCSNASLVKAGGAQGFLYR